MISVTIETCLNDQTDYCSFSCEWTISTELSQPVYYGRPVLSTHVRLHNYTMVQCDIRKLFQLGAFNNNRKTIITQHLIQYHVNLVKEKFISKKYYEYNRINYKNIGLYT